MNPLLLPILDLAAKSTALLLLALGILSLWRRASAPQRSFVWLGCFALLLLLPASLLVQPRWTMNVSTASDPAAVPLAHATAPPVIITTSDQPVAFPATPPAQPAPSSTITVWRVLSLLWAAGVLAVLGHRVLGAFRLHRLRASTRACDDDRAHGMLTSLASHLGIRRHVDLRISHEIAVPMTWGVLRPVLLLPAPALQWEDACLRAALSHEAGHIRHWDALSRGLMTLACALYWPHPLVWTAARRWRVAQEQASDDVVVRGGGHAEAYAMQLLHAAREVQQHGLLRPMPAIAMAQPSTLEARLTAIMDEDKSRRPVGLRALCTGAGIVSLLFLACAGYQLQAGPAAPATPAPAGDKASIAIECVVAVCNDDEAMRRVIELSLRISDLRKGIGPVISGLTTIPGASLFAMGKTYALEAQPWRVSVSRQEKDGGRQVNLFETVPAATPAGVSLVIHRPMMELHGSQINSGGKVTGDDKTTEVQLARGGLVILDGGVEKSTGTDRRLVCLVGAYAVTADSAISSETHTPSPHNRAAGITIPTVNFNNASVKEAVAYLNLMGAKHDPEGKGITILLDHAASSTGTKLTLTLKNVPLIEALRYVSDLAGLRLSRVDNALKLGIAPPGSPAGAPQASPPPSSAALAKAAQITLPRVAFAGASPSEAVEFLRIQSKDHDPAKTGVNIILAPGTSPVQISMDLRDVPLSETLKYVAELSNLELIADDTAIILRPATKSPSASKATPSSGSPAWDKASRLIIPRVEFSGATVKEAIEFFRIKARDADPQKKGVNLLLTPEAPAATITLSLKDVPLSEALRYVAELAGLEIRTDKSSIVLAPKKKE